MGLAPKKGLIWKKILCSKSRLTVSGHVKCSCSIPNKSTYTRQREAKHSPPKQHKLCHCLAGLFRLQENMRTGVQIDEWGIKNVSLNDKKIKKYWDCGGGSCKSICAIFCT